MQDDRLPVGLRCKVELKKVDVVSEEVKLYVEIVSHFHDESCLKPSSSKKFEICNHDMMIRKPKLHILNTNKIETVEDIHLFSPRSGTVFDINSYRVTIQEVLELERFPFDRQVIKFQIQTFGSFIQDWSVEKIDSPYRIVNDKNWANTNHIVLYDDCEWKLEWAESEFVEKERQRVFILSFGISRLPAFYIWNVALFHFVLVLLSTCTYAIDYNDFGARSQVTYTLLLTLVAFKFVVANFVPKISYLTYLDRYSLFSVFMLCLSIAENFVVAIVGNQSAQAVDRWFFAAFAGTWLLLHVVLGALAAAGSFHATWDAAREEDRRDPQCASAATVCKREKLDSPGAGGGGDGGSISGSGSVGEPGSSDAGRKTAWAAVGPA